MQYFKTKQLTLAVASALLSGAALAGTQIPLTLDDAQRVAEADQQSSITVGARTVQANGASTTAFQAWNGSVEQKSSLDVDMNLQGGNAAEGWSIQGSDVGTEIPEFGLEYHKAGVFDVEAGYKRFRHVSNADARFYGNVLGEDDYTTSVQLLDAGVLEQTRDVYRLGGRWMPTDSTEVRAAYQLDDRDGTQRVIAQPAGRAYAGPINDRHHQLDASGEWTYGSFSLEATYYFSKYENNDYKIVRYYDKAGSTTGGNKTDGQRNVKIGLARDPSNTLHRVGLDGLWQISDTSTLSVAAGYAWSKLDDDAFGVGDPTAYNFDAETKIPTFDVAYTARPLQDLSFSAKYGYRKVDNSVDANGYSGFDFRDPSYTQHKLSADAIYSMGKGYSVKAWGSMLDKSYESEIEGNTEWKGGLELRKRMSSTLSGKLAYQYTNRTAEDWLKEGDPKGSAGWFPWSYAAYDEHALRLDLYTNPIDAVTLGFNGSVYTRDYDKDGAKSTAIGVTSSDGFRLGVDADWAINRDFSLFGFYSYDHQKLDREKAANSGYPTDETDQSHTFGLGFDMHPELRPWSLKLQYVYSIDKSDVGYYNASAKDAEYKSHYAEASGSWRLNKDWSIQGTALYGKVDSDDYLDSGLNNTTRTDSRLSANYSAALFYLGVKYNLPM